MATIVTRAGKGAALAHTEVDANFTNLNAELAERNVSDAQIVGGVQYANDLAGQSIKLGLINKAKADGGLLAAQYLLDLIGVLSKSIAGGRASFIGGSAADPAIRIGTAGIYSSATDTLSVAIAGVEILRVTSDGITVRGAISYF